MNSKTFKLISRRLRNAGLPINRETIAIVWTEMKERTERAFDLLNEIHLKIARANKTETYEPNEVWTVTKKAPMAPLGAGNDAFPAGYFDSFTGKLANGQMEVE